MSALIQGQFYSIQTIDLSELTNSKLLSRFDRKYVIPFSELSKLISTLENNYKLLSINGITEQKYKSNYYDSKSFDLYLKHHNKRKNRYKIRTREYIDSKLKFAELKVKNNRGLTEKNRVIIKDLENEDVVIKQLQHQFIENPLQLIKQISIYYHRLTFINNNNEQRVTIDFNLKFMAEEKELKLPNIAIVEIKYGGSIKNSLTPFSSFIKRYESNFSKYCIGISLLYPKIKHNNFQFILKKTIQKHAHS